MATKGTNRGSFCAVLTLSVIETTCTKFGQNPRFSLRKSVSLTPGLSVKTATPKVEILQTKCKFNFLF